MPAYQGPYPCHLPIMPQSLVTFTPAWPCPCPHQVHQFFGPMCKTRDGGYPPCEMQYFLHKFFPISYLSILSTPPPYHSIPQKFHLENLPMSPA